LNYFFLSKGKKHSYSLALASIFNKVSEKNKLKFAIDNIALLSAWTEISSIFDENYLFARRGKKHWHIPRYGEHF
jgi:hypothetical protein